MDVSMANPRYRSVAQVFDFADQQHRLPDQPGDVGGNRRRVEVRPSSRRWPLLEEFGPELARRSDLFAFLTLIIVDPIVAAGEL